MAELSSLIINTVLETKPFFVPYVPNSTTAEDVCIYVCKQLNIGTVARHLFALRTNKHLFLAPCSTFSEKEKPFELRLRFKVPNFLKLQKVDPKAYEYYFHQARLDVLDNKLIEIVFEKHRRDLIGLGVCDMYRVMLEKNIPKETIESEYKKYIPKEAQKIHSIFLKRPIRILLAKLQKQGYDSAYVIAQYLNQFDSIAPEYLTETYKASLDLDGSVYEVNVKVSPHHPTESGIQYALDSKKDEWQKVCAIEEIGFVSIRNDGTVEISRKNGIPFYLMFSTIPAMLAFTSLLDGYYRLTCKWTFNVCKDLPTPSLLKLYSMKCHGPVGGEFSYAKLEEKRSNKRGCFIIRECESKYNTYFIDVCVKDKCKPKTFKLEKIADNAYLFNDDLRTFKNIYQLMAAYNDPDIPIYLLECLPPSEYDVSPLLLCQTDNVLGDSVTDSSLLGKVIPSSPQCINCKDLQVYKGLEYTGEIAKTESSVRCQSWAANTPHKVSDSIKDEGFPEGSRKAVKNYCRNPNRDPLGPWCYSMSTDLIDETCGIPLCSFSQCRITGPGMEYGGQQDKGSSGRKCLKWNKNRKKVKHNDSFIKIEKYAPIKFPEKHLGDAKKFCRNPSGDLGGPWCFIEDEDTYEIQKEYCNIPFCDDPDCLIFTKNDPIYTHYTDFNSTITNLTFGIKVWNPDDYQSASARLVLSLFALPLEAKDIQDLGIGIEIYISNTRTALRFGNKDSVEYEDTPGVLKSNEFTMFSLSWSSGFINFQKLGSIRSIFLAEMKTKKNLMGFKKDMFNFYAAQGSNVLWDFPFCRDDFFCDVQTTTGGNFQQFWMLQEKNAGHDLHVYLRAFHSPGILLVPSPVDDYPRVLIVLQGTDGFTRVKAIEYEKGPANVLHEISLPDLLNYFSWHEFSFTLFADTMQVYWMKSTGAHMLFELKHSLFRIMRWFSVNSINSVAHWTFFCVPPEISNAPPAFLPECALNKEESNYKGTQDITSNGLPCLPWSGTKLLPSEASGLFSQKDIMSNLNYCRDPKNEHRGTFCYTISQKERKIAKSHCKLRKCKSAECKMAGTGNDYIGGVNKTRSNRTCGFWASSNTSLHEIDPHLQNDTLYADTSVEKARNSCRNPSREIAGSWCYTTDYEVPRDVCNIKDCDKPEECTVIAASIPGPKIYILPQWKESGIHGGLHFALKQWNPDITEGVVFEITPRRLKGIISLIIGEDNNEKIVLYHNDKMVKQKVLPHMISTGKWTELWLQIRQGELLLGYKGLPNALFEWHNEENLETFEPMFLSYGTIKGNPVGIFFQCDECHTEVASNDKSIKYFPIGFWSDAERPLYRNFNLTIRGTGIAIIRLITLPGSKDLDQIVFDSIINVISVMKFKNRTKEIVAKMISKKPIIAGSFWTRYNISFTEHELIIRRNGSAILTYQSSEPLLYYWFNVGSKNGIITWSVNCEPVDLDGAPRDGAWSAWSPWHCSVKCGGGEGFRTRNCSNPRPNIFGKLCSGSPTSTGKCNDFECGDVSPYTLEEIRGRLQSQYSSHIVDEGDPVVLTNDQDMLKKIGTESPEAFYEWTLNGIFIKPEKRHITFRGDDVVIEKAHSKDAGLYVCMVHRVNKKRFILKVISLAVKSTAYDISTRATRSVILKCNSVILAYIYTDLSLKWMLNDELYKDYGTTMLAAVDAEKLEPLNTSHSGDWKCVVEQKDLKLSWVTNYIKMEVKKAPNMYTNLMEDELTAPLFGWLKSEKYVKFALVFIVVFVIVSVIIGVVVYLKFCTVRRRRYVKNRRKE